MKFIRWGVIVYFTPELKVKSMIQPKGHLFQGCKAPAYWLRDESTEQNLE